MRLARTLCAFGLRIQLSLGNKATRRSSALRRLDCCSRFALRLLHLHGQMEGDLVTCISARRALQRDGTIMRGEQRLMGRDLYGLVLSRVCQQANRGL